MWGREQAVEIVFHAIEGLKHGARRGHAGRYGEGVDSYDCGGKKVADGRDRGPDCEVGRMAGCGRD